MSGGGGGGSHRGLWAKLGRPNFVIVISSSGGGGGGSKHRKTTPAPTSTTPSAPTKGLREHGNDTTRNSGRSGRRNTATPMQHVEGKTGDRLTKQQPDGMSGGRVGV